MFSVINLIFLILFAFSINFICKKINFLLSYNGEIHQTFVTKDKTPLTGGIILLSSFILFYFNYSLLLSIILILFIFFGILSDLKANFSASLRLVIQSILILSFVFLDDLKIEESRINFLDELLLNSIFNYFFVSFCLLILINGTNFIDGLNTNVIGYYIIISYFLSKSSFLSDLNLDYLKWNFWIFSLLIIFLYNFFRKLFLGDSGAYALAFIYGVFLIKFYSTSNIITPFFIISILWYPCFEMLFSMIRKNIQKKSPLEPDTNHLHQMVFDFFKKNIKLDKNYLNSFVASLFNFYNLVVIYLSFTQPNNSIFQILLISTNVFVYCSIYLILYQKKSNN